jgi:hypothetical protein
MKKQKSQPIKYIEVYFEKHCPGVGWSKGDGLFALGGSGHPIQHQKNLLNGLAWNIEDQIKGAQA